ncbi:MAG: cytochrome b/b6 domain-containing protein [Burkholderiaceae bacterium]|jgi:cytochrome b|nr:cytochrome b/b6 domain-containing protein [Burkholderiaceae bacterium]
MNTVRIWDLPTRLFHWVLVLSVVGLFITGKIGGDAMTWHGRLGYAVLALVLFRLLWGLIGGRWSRFISFVPTPGRLLRYLRGQALPQDVAGHNPLGAFSVAALLLVLAAQVSTGLFADDDIAFTGPLAGTVSGAAVKAATHYHKGWGQGLLIALVSLHVLSIIFYALRGKNLLWPMVVGDKQMAPDEAVPPSADGALQRVLAVAVLALAAAATWWIVTSAPPASY